MAKLTRRDLCFAVPALAAVEAGALGLQVHATESPVPQAAPAATQTVPGNDGPAGAVVSAGTVGAARVIAFDSMPVRRMANGGESRDVTHGTLATGERVNLHASMQVAGATPNPAHVIQHTEFILVREGTVEFEHEVDGSTVAESAPAGSVIYVPPGTKHALKNVGTGAAQYFVVQIGGDAR